MPPHAYWLRYTPMTAPGSLASQFEICPPTWRPSVGLLKDFSCIRMAAGLWDRLGRLSHDEQSDIGSQRAARSAGETAEIDEENGNTKNSRDAQRARALAGEHGADAALSAPPAPHIGRSGRGRSSRPTKLALDMNWSAEAMPCSGQMRAIIQSVDIAALLVIPRSVRPKTHRRAAVRPPSKCRTPRR